MSGTALTHRSVEETSTPITTFNIVMWLLGFSGTIFGLWMTEALGMLFVLPVAILIGWPVKNHGSPHAYLIYRHNKRKSWQDEHKKLRTPPLGSKPRDGNPLEPVENHPVIHAKYLSRSRGSKAETVRTIALLPNEAGTHVTFGLMLTGASHEWLQSDPAGKMAWDSTWMQLMGTALAATNDPDLKFGMVTLVTIPDKEEDHVWAQRRGDPRVMEATLAKERGEEGYDPVDALIGEFVHANTDEVYSIGGEARYALMVRMMWPTSFGRRIDLVDPAAVRRSSLWKVISKLINAYDSSGIICSIATADELNDHWQHVIGLGELPTKHMYRQLRTQRTEEPQVFTLATPESIDDGRRWLRIGDCYFAAGYVKRVVRPTLDPGFQREAVVLPPGSSFSFLTWVNAPLLTSSKRRAANRERGHNFITGALPKDRGVTDIEGDRRLEAIIAARERLIDEGSTRSSEFNMTIVVKETSVEALDAFWDDVTNMLAGYYELERLCLGDEIQDVLCAHLGKV